MQASRLKRSVIRIAGIGAVATALLAPGAIASAAPNEVGLTACDMDGCAIVTMDDLAARRNSTAKAEQSLRPYGPVGFTE